jgi:coenzyme PQQ precursor peptide PqqA
LRPGAPGLKIIADRQTLGQAAMAWTTPILVEICIGLEINGYLPAEL